MAPSVHFVRERYAKTIQQTSQELPPGHILECRGVACAMPLLVDKIKVNLDFHIFDVLDLDLL
jgi:hypothetical protein